jgi:hypothetical protein
MITHPGGKVSSGNMSNVCAEQKIVGGARVTKCYYPVARLDALFSRRQMSILCVQNGKVSIYKRHQSKKSKPFNWANLKTVKGNIVTCIVPIPKQGLAQVHVPLVERWRFADCKYGQYLSLAQNIIDRHPEIGVKIDFVSAPCCCEHGIVYTEAEWIVRNKVKNMRYLFFMSEDRVSSYSTQDESFCKSRKPNFFVVVCTVEIVISVGTLLYCGLYYTSDVTFLWLICHSVGTMLTLAAVGIAKHWNRKHCSFIRILIQTALVVLGIIIWAIWTTLGIYFVGSALSTETWNIIAITILAWQGVRLLVWFSHRFFYSTST